jgi:magnesium-transporting ATPase (P-type)
MIPDAAAPTYWSSTHPALLRQLHSADVGLAAAEARRRLREHGRNIVHSYRRLTRTRVALNQIRNPMLLVLVLAVAASAATGEWVDARIVFVIVLATVGIGFAREYRAEAAAAALQARVRSNTKVLRDG